MAGYSAEGSMTLLATGLFSDHWWDMTSCFQMLLPWPPHHDELDLELGAKANLPLLQLFLSECFATVTEKKWRLVYFVVQFGHTVHHGRDVTEAGIWDSLLQWMLAHGLSFLFYSVWDSSPRNGVTSLRCAFPALMTYSSYFPINIIKGLLRKWF